MKKTLQTLALLGITALSGCKQPSQEPKSGLSLEGFDTNIGYVRPTDINANGIVDGFCYARVISNQKLKYNFLDNLENGVIDHCLVTDEGIVKYSIPRDSHDSGDIINSDIGMSWGMADGVYDAVKIRSQKH